ncbi:MAG: hypothetical protein H0X70_11555 [Segetibacter sp.]|nr:hypothetical protein [Segetibacter sp.]
MIRIFIAAALCLTAQLKVFSQENTAEVLQPKLLLRFNILGLADPLDQNLSFGLEHRFHPNWSTGTDAGWIFASQYVQNHKGVNGFIVRPFIRYYPDTNGAGFFEAELHYKYVAYKIEDWLGREPVNNVPTYEEYTNFSFQKQVVGIHFKAGLQANISRDARFKFEFTGGLGVRYKWHKVRNGLYTRGQRGVINTSQNYFTPALPLNLRLMYAL